MPSLLLIAPIHASRRTTGGGQRTLHLLRALLKLGDVDVLLLSDAATAPYYEGDKAGFEKEFIGARSLSVVRCADQFLVDNDAERWWERWLRPVRKASYILRLRSAAYAPSSSDAAALVQRVSSARHAVIVGRYLQPTALSGALHQHEIPVVVDLDDLDEQLARTRRQSPKTGWGMKLALTWQMLQLPGVLRRLRLRCKHLFVASEIDRLRFPGFPVSVLPNIPFGSTRPIADSQSSQTLLFVGTRTHRPNHEGIRHFLDSCWLEIRARVPDARCRIVGSGGWDTWEFSSSPGVEVVGQVDDLDSEYAAAALCIAPILDGSGTKIKVLEALARGRCVIATPHASAGVNADQGAGLFVATSFHDFARLCSELLTQPERRAQAALAGCEVVLNAYSPERFDQVVAQALNPLLSRCLMETDRSDV